MKQQTEQGVLWMCGDCEYQTKFKPVMFEHVESKHIESAGYNCQHCMKFCRTRNALRSHVTRQHPEHSLKRNWSLLVNKIISHLCFCFHSIGSNKLKSIAFIYYISRWKSMILLLPMSIKDCTENGVVWRCADCGHQTKFRTSLFEHVESKHVESAGYICQFCLKHCRTRNALRSHINRQHNSSK